MSLLIIDKEPVWLIRSAGDGKGGGLESHGRDWEVVVSQEDAQDLGGSSDVVERPTDHGQEQPKDTETESASYYTYHSRTGTTQKYRW